MYSSVTTCLPLHTYIDHGLKLNYPFVYTHDDIYFSPLFPKSSLWSRVGIGPNGLNIQYKPTQRNHRIITLYSNIKTIVHITITILLILSEAYPDLGIPKLLAGHQFLLLYHQHNVL